MEAPAFITFREPDDTGEVQYYILQREHPHYIGVIKNLPREKTLMRAAIPGHILWVEFAGTLRGNFVESRVDIVAELNGVFTDMAEWFYLNRIKPNEKKFKKFKLKSNVPVSNK